jgi:hypothetical protein
MENETHIKQSMSYESRMALVQEHFSKKMALLYAPHVAIKDNAEGKGLYMKEIAEAINSRLPSSIPNNECYILALNNIWKGITSRHKSRYWFSLADCIAATKPIANDCHRMYDDPKKKTTFGNEQSQEDTDRTKGGNWTLEGAIKNLMTTDEMIADGRLPRNMGISFRRIPLAAINRCGGDPTPYETPPATKVTPKTEPPLPPRPEPTPDFYLIKKGMTKPKFDDLPADADFDDDMDGLFDIADPVKSVPDFDAL